MNDDERIIEAARRVAGVARNAELNYDEQQAAFGIARELLHFENMKVLNEKIRRQTEQEPVQ